MATGPTPDLNRVTLKWYGVNLDGTPATGRLILKYNSTKPMLDDDPDHPIGIYPAVIDKAITTTTVTVTGDNGQPTDQTVGYVSFSVPVTDDPDILGSGGTYQLQEKLNNGLGQTVNFEASRLAPNGVIYLNRLTSVTAQPGQVISAVTLQQFSDLTGRVAALEVNGVPGGGGGGGGGSTITSYSTIQALAGYPTAFPTNVGQVFGLTDLLAGKSDLGHRHVSADVTDLDEHTQDLIASTVKAGANVQLAYDDVAGTLTLSATASGGGTVTTDNETVRDVIAAALVAGTGVQVVVNDAADTITLSVTGIPQSAVTGLVAALTGKADLVAGKVAAAQLPNSSGLTNYTTDLDAYLATTGTPRELSAASGGTGAYPARPATARPVHFYGANAPTADGSVAGGGGMVPNLDQWFAWTAQ